MTNAIAERAPRASILAKMAERFSVEPNKLLETLKATAFKGQVSNEQMISLLIVADQYGLNPFTRELFAFPDKGGIVPVVSVDGWARIINSHPQFDGIEFSADDLACTCTIYRKDRGHPISVTEYMAECKRSTGPWQSHPRRMLRHKAMIQCARLAFGFAGIYDEDEAQRIVEPAPARASGGLAAVRAHIAGKAHAVTSDGEIVDYLEHDEQPAASAFDIAAGLAKLHAATDEDTAALIADELRTAAPEREAEISLAYRERMAIIGAT